MTPVDRTFIAEWWAENYEALDSIPNSIGIFSSLCDKLEEEDPYFDGYAFYQEIQDTRDSMIQMEAYQSFNQQPLGIGEMLLTWANNAPYGE